MRIRWAGHVARVGDEKYNTLVGKPERKRPLGRPRRRWMDIRVVLREIGWKDVNCVHLAQDRDQWPALVKTVMNLRVPLMAGKFLIS